MYGQQLIDEVKNRLDTFSGYKYYIRKFNEEDFNIELTSIKYSQIQFTVSTYNGLDDIHISTTSSSWNMDEITEYQTGLYMGKSIAEYITQLSEV